MVIKLKNTINFAEGKFTNNALLWGARGNGKSSLIKSVFHKILISYKNLKLIQLNKNDIFDIEVSLPQDAIVWTVAQGKLIVLEDVTA